jgi:hypothetical protein
MSDKTRQTIKKPIKKPIEHMSDGELSDDAISKNAEKKFLNKEFLDKVIKFLRTDDLIRKKVLEHKEELKVLKDDKLELEQYIIKSLGDMEENFVDIKGNGKLVKDEKITKGTVKLDNIKESIIDSIRKEKLIEDAEKQQQFIDEVLGVIDAKRPRKVKTTLKRTFERKPRQTKKKVDKKDTKKATK